LATSRERCPRLYPGAENKEDVETFGGKATFVANSFSHPPPWVKLKSTKPSHYSNVNGVKILIRIHSLKFIYILDNVYALGYFAINHCMDTQNQFLSTTAI
jgi:hypothetical protein